MAMMNPRRPGQLRAELVQPATSADRARTRRAGSRRSPPTSSGTKRRRARLELRRPLQPGRLVLPQPDRRRAAAHRRRVHVRAEQGRAAGDPRADGRQPPQRRRGPRARDRRRARHGDVAARIAAGGRTEPRPCPVAGAEHPGQPGPTRSPVASSACSSPTAHRPAVFKALQAAVEAEGAERRGRSRPTIGGVDARRRDHARRATDDRWRPVGALRRRRDRRVDRGRRRWLAALPAAKDFVTDAHAHKKFIGYTPAAKPLFAAAGLSDLIDDGYTELTARSAAKQFMAACRQLRKWDRP